MQQPSDVYFPVVVLGNGEIAFELVQIIALEAIDRLPAQRMVLRCILGYT
ncbi:MAG: hypothetical protein JO166_04595 [Deltaproteobacteria bacterium]|nr:hypothetical protein [Deltaproteobacteria bacterium]